MSAPEPTDPAERLADSTAKILHYSRDRFLGTWAALSLLALATVVLWFVTRENFQTDADQTEDIAVLADNKATEAKQGNEQVMSYLKGEQGIPGVPGTGGKTGTPGLPGAESVAQRGPEGPKGATGATGATGLTGPQGPPAAPTLTATPAPSEPGAPGGEGGTGSTGEKGDKGDTGERGPEGPEGPAGAVGATGPPGPQTGVQIVSASSAFNEVDTKSATAQCPAGFRVIGGGFLVNPQTNTQQIQSSFPTTTPQAWTAGGINTEVPWQIVAFAACEQIAQ